ncbi:MAG: RnfH family protein [Burkholderiaceae bacterium]
MTESDSPITVELVWSQADWPQGAPVTGDSARLGALAEPAAQRELRVRSVTLAAGAAVEAVFETCLTDDARSLVGQRLAHVAVFGRRMRPGMPLHDGDRIELLGPVSADPRSARMERVAAERAAAAGPNRWRR